MSGCFSVKPVYFEDDKRIAQKQIEKFHALFNEKRYEEMYELFTSNKQREISKEQFVSHLKDLYSQAGPVENSKLIKIEVRVEASIRLVHMFYETRFEGGKRFEEFDCLTDGEKASIDFYGQPGNIPGVP